MTLESFGNIEKGFAQKAPNKEGKKTKREKPLEAVFEDAQIITEKTEYSTEFDTKIRGIAQKLIPDYDFKRCTFFLQDHPNDINAFVIQKQETTPIVFTKGLFEYVENEDQLAYVIGHELTHHLLVEELGEGPNSRVEEALADLKPIELLHNAGYDTRQSYSLLKKLAKEKKRVLFDIHGDSSDRLLAVKNFLAALDNRVGGLKNKPTKLDFEKLIQNMNFESFFDKTSRKEKYTKKSTSEKIEFLKKHIADVQPFYETRQTTYNTLIRELPTLDQKEILDFSDFANDYTKYTNKYKKDTKMQELKDTVVFAYEKSFKKLANTKEPNHVELARMVYAVPDWYGKEGTFEPIRKFIAKQEIESDDDLTMFNTIIETYIVKYRNKLYDALTQRYSKWIQAQLRTSSTLDGRYTIFEKYIQNTPLWIDEQKGIPGITDSFKMLLDISVEAKTKYRELMKILPPDSTLYTQADRAFKDFLNIREDTPLKKSAPRERKLRALNTIEKGEQITKLKEFLLGLISEIQSLDIKDEDKAISSIVDLTKKIRSGITSLVTISPEEGKQFLPFFLKEIGTSLSGIIRVIPPIGGQYTEMITKIPNEILPIKEKLQALNYTEISEIQMEADIARISPDYIAEIDEIEDDLMQKIMGMQTIGCNLEEYINTLFATNPKTTKETLALHNTIKKIDRRFANDFLRVALTTRLEKFSSEVNAFEVVKALDKNPSSIKPMLVAGDEFITKLLSFHINNEHRWPEDLASLTAFYEILNRKNFFPIGSNTREKMAQKIITKTDISILSLEEKITTLETLYLGPRLSDPTIRKILTESLTSKIQELCGIDDGTGTYSVRMEDICTFLKKINLIDRYNLAREISESLSSQEKTSFMFRDALIGEGISRETLIQNGLEIMEKEFYYEIFSSYANEKKVINFLLSPFSKKNAEDIVNDMVIEATREGTDMNGLFMGKFARADKPFVEKKILDVSNLFYQNFWSSSFPLRTAMIDKMLNQADTKMEAWEYGYDIITKKLIPQNDPYREDINLFLRNYLDVIPEYQKSLFLCALMTAQQKSQESEKFEPGKILASILELLGPAEIKAGQVAHSYPDTPEDIANGLGRLKSKADVPSRWEIFEMRNKLIPEEILSRIARTEKIHAASINITVHVIEKDGSNKILIFERENAKDRIYEGFNRLSQMSDKIGGTTMQSLKEILVEAQQLTDIETDEESNLKQSEIAFENYSGLTLDSQGETWKIQTPKILFYGDQYEYMEYMQGEHFNDLPDTNTQEKEEKRDIAKKYLTTEFAMTFSGKQTDRDRHGDNIRIDIQNKTIGLFDFGGLDLETPKEVEKEALFDVFLTVIQSPAESLSKTISASIEQKIAANPELKSFLRRQEQRFLALGDYLKIIDENDLRDIFFSALKIENLDPVFEKKLLIQFGIDKNTLTTMPGGIQIQKNQTESRWNTPIRINREATKSKTRVLPEEILKKK